MCGNNYLRGENMNFKAKMFNELTTTELYEIIKSRAEIFLLEQKIICQDLDDIDYDSLHLFFEENKRIVAYLRAYYINGKKTEVKIGRVLTLNHGSGIGRKLMEESLVKIKEVFCCEKICINAQKHAVGFYEKFGFKVTSDEFLEEGIPHISMELKI